MRGVLGVGSGKPTALIFGAGHGGRNAFRALRRRFSVTAFVDNDSETWGKRLLGRPVLPPDAIVSTKWDKVLVASYRGDEIVAQLMDMGIAGERIEMLPGDLLSVDTRAPLGCLLLVVALSALAGVIMYASL